MQEVRYRSLHQPANGQVGEQIMKQQQESRATRITRAIEAKKSNKVVAAIVGKEATTRAKRLAESVVTACCHGKEKT